MKWSEADSNWWAACYMVLMIIMDEMYEVFYALMKCKLLNYIQHYNVHFEAGLGCLNLFATMMQKLSKASVHLSSVFSKQRHFIGPLLFLNVMNLKGTFIQVGALEDSLHSSTLLEGSGRCSHVEHSAWNGNKKKVDELKYSFFLQLHINVISSSVNVFENIGL